jgi:disease resistance protein RPS2
MLEGADGRKYVPEWVYKVLKKVERKKNKLISNRDFVELKVDTTDRKIEKINGDVLDWLRETDILLQEIENLKTQLKVPSWNEFKKLQERIKALNVKCNKFDSFSTPIPSLERFSSRSTFMCFKSIKKASDELLVALKDDDCSVIGLYGRRGSGKTTLVKAMSKKVKFLKMFYEVLSVTVTENPNIEMIQHEIADSLDIRFDKYTETRRGMMISSTINNLDRPILVIFDDVRKKIGPAGYRHSLR